jgi:4-hydroxy-tetrahydrodipicolinate synthase
MTGQVAVTPHYAAIVTPFDDNGVLDEKSLRLLSEHIVELEGITGLVVNANAAEVDALTQSERRSVLRTVAEIAHAAGRTAVAGLAPTPSSFAGAVENARQFAEDGADSLLVLGPPAFGRGIDAEPHIAGEYAAQIFHGSRLPIIYFLAGRLSGIDYTPAVITQICKADGVVAVKDTMWSTEGFALTKATVASANPRVQVLTGNDNCVLSTMVAGASGTLLILNCLIGREIVDMYRAIQANDLRCAQQVDARLSTVIRLLFQRPMLKMASRVKLALQLKGVIASAQTRLPVPTLSTSERLEIETAMRVAGLL